MKITKAMYMVSSMKVQKAKNKLAKTEPYFYGLKKQIADILLHFPEIRHLYFDNRPKDLREEVKKKGFIIVTGDKGMAGAYNLNILKQARETIAGARDFRLFWASMAAPLRYCLMALSYSAYSLFAPPKKCRKRAQRFGRLGWGKGESSMGLLNLSSASVLPVMPS